MSPRRRSGLGSYFQRTNLLTSLVLVFPLFLIYQLGVVALPGVGNGADFITGYLVALLGHSRSQYLLLNLGLAATFVLLLLVLRRTQRFDPGLFAPVLLESTFYALTMGSLILRGMRLVGFQPTLQVDPVERAGLLTRFALAVGAGVNEELLFRLILLSAFVWLLEKVLRMRRGLALTFGFAATALVFSAAHHVVGGEPWRLAAFVYRFGCGLVFAALFQWRGFAVAVYTHALYDVLVMVFR